MIEAAREEARRKKLGRRANQYSIDKQPWRMKINEADGKEKKLHSIREAAGTHADYWLFLKVRERGGGERGDYRDISDVVHSRMERNSMHTKWMIGMDLYLQSLTKLSILMRLRRNSLRGTV